MVAVVGALAAGSVDSQLADLRAEVAALRGRLEQSQACSSGQGECCMPCEGRAGWEAGYAFLFAKPHYKESFEASSMSLLTGTFRMLFDG